MNPKELKICIDKSVEYDVKYPSDKKIIDELISVVTTSSLKQEMLHDDNNTFSKFISSILTKKKRNKKNVRKT